MPHIDLFFLFSLPLGVCCLNHKFLREFFHGGEMREHSERSDLVAAQQEGESDPHVSRGSTRREIVSTHKIEEVYDWHQERNLQTLLFLL